MRKRRGHKKQRHVEKLQVSILISLPCFIFPRYHHALAQHHNLTVNQPFGNSLQCCINITIARQNLPVESQFLQHIPLAQSSSFCSGGASFPPS